MTDTEKCIKLALAMGLKSTKFQGKTVFCRKDSRFASGYTDWDDFNPFKDANDCNALIKHLNELGWQVQIRHRSDKTQTVAVSKGIGYEMYEGDNWMHGVCELALKVIE